MHLIKMGHCFRPCPFVQAPPPPHPCSNGRGPKKTYHDEVRRSLQDDELEILHTMSSEYGNILLTRLTERTEMFLHSRLNQ